MNFGHSAWYALLGEAYQRTCPRQFEERHGNETGTY